MVRDKKKVGGARSPTESSKEIHREATYLCFFFPAERAAFLSAFLFAFLLAFLRP